MRKFLIIVTILSCLGCDRAQEALKNPKPQANQAGGAAPQAKPLPQRQKKRPKPNAIGFNRNRKHDDVIQTRPAVVIDLKTIEGDPNYRIVPDMKLNITDPITGISDAYFRMASKASTFGLQRAIQLYQATHEKFPAFDEFMKIMKEHQVEFADVRSYEMYGYSEETGEIVLVEDLALKTEIYEKYGLDPNAE